MILINQANKHNKRLDQTYTADEIKDFLFFSGDGLLMHEVDDLSFHWTAVPCERSKCRVGKVDFIYRFLLMIATKCITEKQRTQY